MLLWQALLDESDGGAPLLSYNVQWDQGSGSVDTELVGYSVPYLALSYLVTSATEGLVNGATYKFRYRASNKYGWGDYSEVSSILAADVPQQAAGVETRIENKYVKVLWAYPNDSSAPIMEYEVKIKTKAGTYLEESTYCDGKNPAIVLSRYCHIPETVLRSAPYSLEFKDPVIAIFKARNVIGWAD